MKHQSLFSSKDKSKNNKNVVCCNFAWRFKAIYIIFKAVSIYPGLAIMTK